MTSMTPGIPRVNAVNTVYRFTAAGTTDVIITRAVTPSIMLTEAALNGFLWCEWILIKTAKNIIAKTIKTHTFQGFSFQRNPCAKIPLSPF